MKRTLTNKKCNREVLFDIINTMLLVFILILVLYPLIFVISASLSNPMKVLQGEVWLLPKEINLLSYQKIFMDSRILTGYKNTVVYTFIGTIISLILTIIGAYTLSRKDLYGRNIITAILAFTMFFQGGLIPTYLIIKKLNMLNTLWAVVIPDAVIMWNLIVMRTFFQNSIPRELEEAAFVDGCTNIKIILKIILPLSKPIIAVMALFYGVENWNAFFNALIYLTDQNQYPLQIILREILLQAQFQETIGDMENYGQHLVQAEGIKYALIIVASLPALLIYPFIQKHFVKGIMIGAIKG